MPDHVKELRELLGEDVLLLAWPLGRKGTKRKWKHLTVADMTPEYLARLPKGNIGVALGEKSGGLCSIDVDQDKFIPAFEAVNSLLKDTLRSRGARGCNFWVRFTGPYPKRTRPLKTHAGENCGEFRSTGSQTIIHGQHPDGGVYTHNGRKPVVIAFSQITWPTIIANPPSLTPIFGNCTEEPDDTEGTEETKDTDVVIAASFFTSIKTVEDALRVSLPDDPHQNNHHLFTLARAVKALERSGGKFQPSELKAIFNQWYERAKRFVRPNQTREDYMMEFLAAYRRAKFPLGGFAIAKAWQQAKEQPLPGEAIQFESPQRRLLVAMCHQLQIIAGKEPFYLSSRTCQRLFGHDTHSTAAMWSAAFVGMGILEEVEKGKKNRATRYRYVGATLASTI